MVSEQVQAPQPSRPVRKARLARVIRKQHLTPRMIRVVLGGEDLVGMHAGEFTDHYVKLLLPARGADYVAPFDVEEIRRTRPQELWPVTRAYTVREWDDHRAELTLDFVHHGDAGVGGPWAAAAEPGDMVALFGPGGGYAPDPHADWHLLVGDESALPAIAVALLRIGPGTPVVVFVEVEDASEEQPLPCAGDLDLVWVHRDASESPAGEELVRRVRCATWLPGDAHVFLHGDAGWVKELRRYFRFERGVARDRMSASGYWRRGLDDEGWRASKRAWNGDVEQEEQTRAGD